MKTLPWLRVGCAVLALQAALPAAAQSPAPTAALAPVAGASGAAASARRIQIVTTQRLGDALAAALEAHAAGPADAAGSSPAPVYELGVMWLSPAQLAADRATAAQVQAGIAALAERGGLGAGEARTLAATLRGWPATGRVALPQTDARLLQVHPALDPVLQPGDELVLPPRPRVVAVLRDDGSRCDVRHQPGRHAAAYVSLCPVREPADAPVDAAWLVQPDGRIARVGVADWNARAQAEPAPGAWLWVPRRAAGWPEAVSDAVARVLASQGPAGVDTSAVAANPEPTRPVTLEPPAPRDLPLVAGDWGITGLLQTPTARTRPAGDIGFTVSRTLPYTQSTLTLSPFDRLEVAVRYTDIGNRLYGAEIAGDRAYKDKSSEVKLRVWDESARLPAVSIGLRDPGGTGLFAGEYVVASKRYGAFDTSFGLGWGYLGGSGNLKNPLAVFGPRFAQRNVDTLGSGGTAHWGTLFTGRTALFGGVQWHSPWEPLLVKLELDGNDYRREPFEAQLAQRRRLNVGAVWRQGPLDVTFGLERGRQWTLGLTLHGSLPALATPKLGAARAVPVDDALLAPAASVAPMRPPAAAVAPDPAAPARHAATLRDVAGQTGWSARALLERDDEWELQLDDAAGLYAQARLDRAAAVLHRDAPGGVRRFRFVLAPRGVAVAEHRVDRLAWVRAATRWPAPGEPAAALWRATAEVGDEARSETRPPARTDRPTEAPGEAPPRVLAAAPAAPFDGGVNLGFQQTIGGPDGYLYALTARAHGRWRPWPGTLLQGTLQARLLDNYERFKYTAPSELPRVRTYLREYLTSAPVTLPNLQLSQFAKLSGDVYGLVYGGLLEPMFAGAGAELMWRPAGSRWAVGVDLNRVQQRGFDQNFALRDYRVATGHLSLHWDTGWNDVVAQLSAGQYLAGDRGATLDLARVFANGTRIGAWVTRTNVSAARFGEGSFDKGVYVSIPFDALFTSWSGQSATLAWQPLVRDGGARLQRYQTLWALTQPRDGRALRYAAPEAGAGAP